MPASVSPLEAFLIKWRDRSRGRRRQVIGSDPKGWQYSQGPVDEVSHQQHHKAILVTDRKHTHFMLILLTHKTNFTQILFTQTA